MLEYAKLHAKGQSMNKLKHIKNHIEKIPDSNFQFYGTLISLVLIFFSIYLNIKYFDSEIVYYHTCILIFIGITILIYVTHFRNVEKLSHSIFFSILSATLTGVVTYTYLKYFKEYSGISMPIAFISQDIISKYIKRLFNTPK